MRLRAEQLAADLGKRLLPIYLVSGDEPLQVNEAADAIRAAARAQGFDERQVLQAETGFDWSSLAAAGDSLSLFAARKLIELRLPSAKPGDAGSKALVAYAERPSRDDLLLIICGKLEKAQQNGKWFKALDAAGVTGRLLELSAYARPTAMQRGEIRMLTEVRSWNEAGAAALRAHAGGDAAMFDMSRGEDGRPLPSGGGPAGRALRRQAARRRPPPPARPRRPCCPCGQEGQPLPAPRFLRSP